MKIKDAAAEFLGQKRIAVTGVSRTPKSHGSNIVYERLRTRGYQVFAVNPNAETVEGDTAYLELKSIPGGVDAVVIGTRSEIAEQTMRECVDLGIKLVWMHRGPGRGSEAVIRHRSDRRRMPVDVRTDRRRRAQGDEGAVDAHRQSAANRLTPRSLPFSGANVRRTPQVCPLWPS